MFHLLENRGLCNITDLIVAALAQNGQFNKKAALDQLSALTGEPGRGDIDWAAFINGNTHGGDVFVKLREGATNTRYGYLMLIKYARDLKELYNRGWKLPKDIEIKDLDWLEDWATENGKINTK